MARLRVLYETFAVNMFAAPVVWIPSQNLYWLLFWHGSRLGRQTPLVTFNWQQAALVTVKPEIEEPHVNYHINMYVPHSKLIN